MTENTPDLGEARQLLQDAIAKRAREYDEAAEQVRRSASCLERDRTILQIQAASLTSLRAALDRLRDPNSADDDGRC